MLNTISVIYFLFRLVHGTVSFKNLKQDFFLHCFIRKHVIRLINVCFRQLEQKISALQKLPWKYCLAIQHGDVGGHLQLHMVD